MGKGDIKSKKGKLSNGTFGNSRKRKSATQASASVTPVEVKETAKPAKPVATAKK